MKLCTSCLVHPEGVAGHADLRLDEFATGGRGTNLFICEACRTSWRRTYIGADAFEWQLLESTVSS